MRESEREREIGGVKSNNDKWRDFTLYIVAKLGFQKYNYRGLCTWIRGSCCAFDPPSPLTYHCTTPCGIAQRSKQKIPLRRVAGPLVCASFLCDLGRICSLHILNPSKGISKEPIEHLWKIVSAYFSSSMACVLEINSSCTIMGLLHALCAKHV